MLTNPMRANHEIGFPHSRDLRDDWGESRGKWVFGHICDGEGGNEICEGVGDRVLVCEWGDGGER